MLRRIALSSAALLALALAASACSGGDDDDDGSSGLAGGTYEFTIAQVSSDTCWPEDNLVPPQGVATIDLLVSASGGDVTISPSPAARFYFQPLAGTLEGDEFVGLEGNGTLVVTTDCDVSVTNAGTGLVDGEGRFDLSVVATLQAMSSGSSGCAALAGETWPGTGIAFPTLTDPTDGSCAVSYEGTAVLPAE